MKRLKTILQNDTIRCAVVPSVAIWVSIIAAVAIPLSPMF